MSEPMEASQRPRQKVIAAIPCFNTASSIADVVSRSSQYVDQVIVVDDGSSDDTAEKARQAGAFVISHSANGGYGEAIKSCFEAGKANEADILVTLDGDGQHDPEEIQRVVAPILNNATDMVIGSRFLSQQITMPGYRRFGIRIITLLVNLGSKVKVYDAQSGFRAYSRQALNAISVKESGMSISVEILIRARKAGLRVKEVATSCQYHPSSSTKNPVVHGLEVAFSVVRLRLERSSGRLAVGDGNA